MCETREEKVIADVIYDNVIQRIKRNEILSEGQLELALSCVESLIHNTSDEELLSDLKNISTKMKDSQLSEYERSIVVDIIQNRDYEKRRKERKSIGASFGHVTRQLKKNAPLRGKILERALELVDVQGDSNLTKLLKNIGIKMKAGRPLDDYERHIMIDVIIPQSRFGF